MLSPPGTGGQHEVPGSETAADESVRPGEERLRVQRGGMGVPDGIAGDAEALVDSHLHYPIAVLLEEPDHVPVPGEEPGTRAERLVGPEFVAGEGDAARGGPHGSYSPSSHLTTRSPRALGRFARLVPLRLEGRAVSCSHAERT